MIRRVPAAIVLSGLVLAAPAWAHRFFVSLAEMDYDADRHALEVSLRIDDHNLEEALRARLGPRYRLTADAGGERDARSYVAEHFVLAARDGKALELKWIGWEWSPGIAWLHFEFPVDGDPAELRLTNSIFLELSERQINTVNVRLAGARRTLSFDRRSREQRLGIVSGARP